MELPALALAPRDLLMASQARSWAVEFASQVGPRLIGEPLCDLGIELSGRGRGIGAIPFEPQRAEIAMIEVADRITVNPEQCGGRPCIRGLRIRVIPDRFGAQEHARGFSRDFFHWYNFEHHHSGLGLLTPADVHCGRAPERVAALSRVLAAAYAQHPERFVGGLPQPAPVPATVWINKPQQPEREPAMPAAAH